MHEFIYVVVAGKALVQFNFVFKDSAILVICHSRIEDGSVFIGENVNVIVVVHIL